MESDSEDFGFHQAMTDGAPILISNADFILAMRLHRMRASSAPPQKDLQTPAASAESRDLKTSITCRSS